VSVDGVEVSRARQTVPALHRALTRKGSYGPWRGGASESRDPHASTCAHGNRACAFAGARWAGKSVSRGRREEKSCSRGSRGRASLAEPWYTTLSTDRGARTPSKCDEPTRLIHRCGEWCGVMEIPANSTNFFPSFHRCSRRKTLVCSPLPEPERSGNAAWIAQLS
jgi:hypothetical protein